MIIATLAFAIVTFPHLPEQMATHWNAAGKPDDYSSRSVGAFLSPALAATVWLLLVAARKIDPRRSHYERFEDTYWIFLNILVLFFALLEVLVVGYSLGWPIDLARTMMALIGLLAIGLGNYLPRIRSNWWIGIRTPWTLESERVWRDTHRVGGWTFVTAGVITLVALWLPSSVGFWVSIGSLFAAGLIPVLYSYFDWSRGHAATRA